MTLNTKMSMDELISIRKMARAKALEFIAQFDLTDEEKEAAIALMQPEAPVDPRYDTRIWVVVAYLLGASLRMIAKDKGSVSPQSVYAQIERVLPDTKTRSDLRLAHTLSYEAMAEYKIKYFENVDTFRGQDPRAIATWLLANTDLDVEV